MKKDVFLIITDVGNAAAHRGDAPSRSTLNKVLSAVEAFLYRDFIVPIDAKEIRAATTPRSPPGNR